MRSLSWWVAVGIAAFGAGASLAPGPVSAQGYAAVSWDDCGAAGALDKDFDCATELGESRLCGWFVAPPGVERFQAFEFTLRVTSDLGTMLPAWWSLGTEGCRPGAASVVFDSPGPNCRPFLAGSWQAVSIFTPPTGSHSFVRGALGVEVTQPLPAGTELYAFTMIVHHTGLDECGGCCVPVCLLFDWFALYQDDRPIELQYLYEFGVPGWQHGSWSSVGCLGAPSPACAATPTRTSTWGALKALYR